MPGREKVVPTPSITRRDAAKAITSAAVLAGFPAILSARNRRPNFLFFMPDDQRFDALSSAGNRILKTPHMDRIATGGVRFAEAFVSDSLCSPSRATIVTGLYAHTHRVTWNTGPHHFLDRSLPTFPKLLQQAGYFTALTGKWHIASPPEGFDHWCILPGQGRYHNPAMLVRGARVKMRGYVDDVIADQALDTLANRPKDRPFCLLCWFKAPHRSWRPAARYLKAFEDITIPEPPTFQMGLGERPAAIRNSDLQIADMPDFYQMGVPADAPRSEQKRLNYQLFVKQYYRVLLGVDYNVGRLLDYLDKNGLAENTFVLHTADNGFFMGEYGLFDKRMMYEPSIRVPMLTRYPAGFDGGRLDSEHMVLNNDICPTILDYAGVPRPDLIRHHGASWRSILEGKADPWRSSWLYEFFEYPAVGCVGKMRGVRTKRWKLVHYTQEPEQFELFDLVNDPEERRNLYEDPAFTSQRERLRAELERLRDLTRDDRSENGTPPQPCTIRIARRPSH